MDMIIAVLLFVFWLFAFFDGFDGICYAACARLREERIVKEFKATPRDTVTETWQHLALTPYGLCAAVKEYRLAYGVTLREAKEAVDNFLARHHVSNY